MYGVWEFEGLVLKELNAPSWTQLPQLLLCLHLKGRTKTGWGKGNQGLCQAAKGSTPGSLESFTPTREFSSSPSQAISWLGHFLSLLWNVLCGFAIHQQGTIFIMLNVFWFALPVILWLTFSSVTWHLPMNFRVTDKGLTDSPNSSTPSQIKQVMVPHMF